MEKYQTKIMGILNITPDSFSGDGLLSEEKPLLAAVKQAEQFIQDGADILDIGAESTRPGASIVSEMDEIERVVPVITEINKHFPDVPLSIDTYKARVAEEAIQVGATWINDVWGFKADSEMANIAAKYQVKSVLMHNRLKTENTQIMAGLGGRYVGVKYQDLILDIKNELHESISIASGAGLSPKNIILDPGIGFGKTVEQSLLIIQKLKDFEEMGFPILIGPSRKSFIGYTLDLPPEERVEGTMAAVVLGIVNGASIVRVHDVRAISRAVKMTDAILNAKTN